MSFLGRVIAGAAGLAWLPQLDAVAFGVRHDGVTDDTLAVRALVAAVAARGGGTAQLGPGVVRITGEIHMPAGVRLRGASRGATTVLPQTAAANSRAITMVGSALAVSSTTQAAGVNSAIWAQSITPLALAPFQTADAAQRLCAISIGDDFSGLSSEYFACGPFSAPSGGNVPLAFAVPEAMNTTGGVDAAKFAFSTFLPLREAAVEDLTIDCVGMTGTGFCHAIEMTRTEACVLRNVTIRNVASGCGVMANIGYQNDFSGVVVERCGTAQWNSVGLYRQSAPQGTGIRCERATGFGPGAYFCSYGGMDQVWCDTPAQRGPKFAGCRAMTISQVAGLNPGSTSIAISQGSSFNSFGLGVAIGANKTPGNNVGLWFADQRCVGNFFGGLIAHNCLDYAIDVGATDTANTVMGCTTGGVGNGIRNQGAAYIVANGTAPPPQGFGYVTGAGNQTLEVVSGGVSGAGVTLRPAGGGPTERMVLGASGDLWLSPRSTLAMLLQSPASAVNYLWVRSSVTGSDPRLDVLGSDADRGLVIAPRGTGRIRLSGRVQGDALIATTVQPDSNNAWTMDFPSATQARISLRDTAGTTRSVTLTLA